MFSPWGWAAAAAALAAGELAVPGLFLIWLAGAATLTAGLAALGLPAGPQLAAFASLSVAAVLVARQLTGGNDRHPPARLNRRGEALIGEVVTVTQPLSGSASGQVRVGDTVWPARGPALPEGAPARIVGLDGATLLVEAA